MKVFISWSDPLSKQIALILRDWLPSIIQSIDPWVSSEDIDKGARWSSDLTAELLTTKAGIICVTPDNGEAAWLNVEAGALSKVVDKSMVCPYLYGIKQSELKGPLVQFQGSEASKEDTFKLIHTLNKAQEPKPLAEGKLSEAFELWWPRLESQLGQITPISSTKAPTRTSADMLDEVLNVVRQVAKESAYVSSRMKADERRKRFEINPQTFLSSKHQLSTLQQVSALQEAMKRALSGQESASPTHDDDQDTEIKPE